MIIFFAFFFKIPKDKTLKFLLYSDFDIIAKKEFIQIMIFLKL